MSPVTNVTNPFSERSAAKRYHQYRPQYHHLPFQQLQSFLGHRIDRALDVACGTGHSTMALKQVSDSVIGCDLSAAMLEEAKQNPNIEFLQSTAEQLPFPDQTFDYVHISMAFQWLNQIRFLKESQRILKTTGYLGIDNYGCTGMMKGFEEFQKANREFDRNQMPSAPRNPDFPSSEILSESRYKLAHEIRYEHWVPMTSSEFTNYLMTRSNFLILPDSKKAEVESLMSQFYHELFDGSVREIRFAGLMKLYQPFLDR